MPQITTTDTVITLQEGESLLDALEKSGHDVHYQCKSGYCGSCRIKLTSGSVSYDELPMAFVMPGEILACCCKVSGDISVECRLRRAQQDLFGYGDELFGPGPRL